MNRLTQLDPVNPSFPETESALHSPDGLLAVGGNLAPNTLIRAYNLGIFPWFSEAEPILWWSPSRRAVLLPNQLYLSRGSRKQLRKLHFTLTTNQAFDQVIESCASTRQEEGTWISPDIIAAYISLHESGTAHSLEVWDDGELVGGLYGLKIGSVFCGESMFNIKSNAAKFAFCNLAFNLFAHGFTMIDCQIPNEFLGSLGVASIARSEFEVHLLNGMTDSLATWPTVWKPVEI